MSEWVGNKARQMYFLCVLCTPYVITKCEREPLSCERKFVWKGKIRYQVYVVSIEAFVQDSSSKDYNIYEISPGRSNDWVISKQRIKYLQHFSMLWTILLWIWQSFAPSKIFRWQLINVIDGKPQHTAGILSNVKYTQIFFIIPLIEMLFFPTP